MLAETHHMGASKCFFLAACPVPGGCHLQPVFPTQPPPTPPHTHPRQLIESGQELRELLLRAAMACGCLLCKVCVVNLFNPPGKLLKPRSYVGVKYLEALLVNGF